MKIEEGKSKVNQRKKEINYYCIFNNENEQLSNKIKTIFRFLELEHSKIIC